METLKVESAKRNGKASPQNLRTRWINWHYGGGGAEADELSFDELIGRLSTIKKKRMPLIIGGYIIAGLLGLAYSCLNRISLPESICLVFAVGVFFGAPAHEVYLHWTVNRLERGALFRLASINDSRALVPVINHIDFVKSHSASNVNRVGCELINTLESVDESTGDTLPAKQRAVLRSLISRYPNGPWEGEETIDNAFTIAIIRCLTRVRDIESLRAIRHVAKVAVNLEVKVAAKESVVALRSIPQTHKMLLRASAATGETATMLRVAEVESEATDESATMLRAVEE